MKKLVKILLSLVVTATVVLFTGCTAPNGMSHSQRYGLNGAGAGALLGGVAGNNIDGINTLEGAVAGGVAGAVIGIVTGKNRDIAEKHQHVQSQPQQQPQQIQQQSQSPFTPNSPGMVPHDEAHRQGISHTHADLGLGNGHTHAATQTQPQSEPNSTYSNRSSDWRKTSAGYELERGVNVTNIYGNVYTGQDGYRYYDNCNRCHRSHRISRRCF